MAAMAVRMATARASAAFRAAQASALELALAEIGDAPNAARMRELGGFTAVASRAVERIAPAEHDEPPYGDDAGWIRRALFASVPELRARIQAIAGRTRA